MTEGRRSREAKGDEDGEVVADAAEVARAGVGAEGLVAGVGGIACGEERDWHCHEPAFRGVGQGGHRRDIVRGQR